MSDAPDINGVITRVFDAANSALRVSNGGGTGGANIGYGTLAARPAADGTQGVYYATDGGPDGGGAFYYDNGGTWASMPLDESLVTSLVTDLGDKAPLASPTFTGTVSGITAAMVGLGSVTDDAQLKASQLDTDTGLTANSDTRVASQKAVKAYTDAETSRAEAAEGLLAPKASPTFTGVATSPAFSASGSTGALAGARLVGATTSGAPTSGTFAVGDFVIDQSGAMWICTSGGTPGSWANPSTSIQSLALELALSESVYFSANRIVQGNTGLLVSQTETLNYLPKVSTIAADGTAWTVQFASSILGTYGQVGDTFKGWISGFTPSGWNTGSSTVPVTFTITDSIHATTPNATTPATITAWGRCEAIPTLYGVHTAPPGIIEVDGLYTFGASVHQLYGAGPVFQNYLNIANGPVVNFSATVTNGSNVVVIAGDQRATIAVGLKAIVPTGTPPSQDTTKLAANAYVQSVSYDGTNTNVTLLIQGTASNANWLGTTGTATIYFAPDIVTPEGVVNGPVTIAEHGVPISFPLNPTTWGQPGNSQGWSMGYSHNPVFKAFSSASALININDIGAVYTAFFGTGAIGLQRIGAYIADALTARSNPATPGSVAKQIGLVIGSMTPDTTDYYPLVGASNANGNIGILNASTTVNRPAPAVAYAASTVTLTTTGQTVTFDTNAGFSPTGGSLIVPTGSGKQTTATYTGTTGTTQLTGVKVASGTATITAAQVVFSANSYQDVSAGTFTVQAYATTAALYAAASVAATTAASVISTGTPLYSGQVLRIVNVSGAGVNLTFSSGGSTGLLLGAPARVLRPGAVLELQYSATLSAWCEVSFTGSNRLLTHTAYGAITNPTSATSLLGGAVSNLWPVYANSGDMVRVQAAATAHLASSSTVTITIYCGSTVVATIGPSTASTSDKGIILDVWFKFDSATSVRPLGRGVMRLGTGSGFTNVTAIGDVFESDGAPVTVTATPQDFDIKATIGTSNASSTVTLLSLDVSLHPS